MAFSGKIPVPIIIRPFDIPLTIKALVGYHEENNGKYGVIRGAEYGGQINYYPLEWLGLHLQYTQVTLLQGRMRDNYINPNFMTLPRFETGISLNLPYNVMIGAGYRYWNTSYSFYNDDNEFGYDLLPFSGLVVGLNWKFFDPLK